MIQSVLLATNAPGEVPPPAPRACFGRNELIEEIVGLAENLEPMALIGAGGIGKTSIALKVLHHDRIKQRFGENRRFIRCDQFPATLPHFLNRLSKVTGAGVENPDYLAPLLSFLSSKEILIVLDNAESILDPQGTNAQEIYASIEELCQLETVCICITSRISTIPPDCQALDVPTLSMEPARDVFHRIYKRHGRSDLVDGILTQLEFHPLSVTLLATVAQQNRWDMARLSREWEGRRTSTLETKHQTSLATTIELSLASPMFKELGPDARGLLGVVAFYPQGVSEKNIDLLLPTISDRTRIFDDFCILSLTYRSNGFITMLAPLRDYFRPNDPVSSPVLRITKESYFTRMSAILCPTLPGFEDAQWVIAEDVNIEYLLDVFTSVDPDSDETWDAYVGFVVHLVWYKPRQTMLRKKIEGLPDNHPIKPKRLSWLAKLAGKIGNSVEQASFLNKILTLQRERGDDHQVARTLRGLSGANQALGRYKEGINQAREALEIYERLGATVERPLCLNALGQLLRSDGQLDAAEESVLQSIKLLPEEGEELQVCLAHFALGCIYSSKGERERAICHYEVALGIVSTFNWRPYLFELHLALVELFLDEDRFDDAQAHIEQAQKHALNNPYNLGSVAHLQAQIWYRKHRLKDAASEALRAKEIFEKLGALGDFEACRGLLRKIGGEIEGLPPSGESGSNGELSETIACPAPTNSLS